MSSKLVVPADIFTVFETEKLTKFPNEKLATSSSKNSAKPVKKRRNRRKQDFNGQINNNDLTESENTRKFPNILKKNLNRKLINGKLEKSNILDKMASGDANCSNRDNNESLVNGEPPRTVAVLSTMTDNVENSAVQTVERDGSVQLKKLDNFMKNKNSVLLIKSFNGKSIPLVLKNSVLLKSDEDINKISTEISTSNAITSVNNKTSEVLINNTETLEKSTKISTEISTKISTAAIKNKLVIHRKLVTIPTPLQVKRKPVLINPQICSISSKISTPSVQKTSSGKPKTIPNKKPLKVVEILEKPTTKKILINNQLVPISANTKFQVDTGVNTEKINTDDKDTLNIITQKSVDKPILETKILKHKFKKTKISTEEKVYQLQVPDDKETSGPTLHLPIKSVNDEVDILNKCVQLRMCVENWTQTEVKTQDCACQTDVYVPPTPVIELEPVQEDCPNIPELIQFILGSSKYNTGMDETTKTDILNNSQKFKPPEPGPIVQATNPPRTLKEQLFCDLRDCIGFDFLGNMPIHNAVVEENLKDLKRQVFALRLRRFTVDVENNFNQTALQLAVIHNRNEEIIATLLSNGANVRVKDSIGNSLLHLAVLNTNQHVLALILGYLNRDAKVLNAKNDEGLTALMVAAIECKAELVAVLLEKGADPNLRDDKSGRTALFHAVELNNIPVINLLLQNKADPKIRNYFGLTALDAVKEQNTSVAHLIEKQVTRTNPQMADTGSPSPTKRRHTNNKRSSPEQPNVRMGVVSKKIKVDLDASNSRTGIKTCSPARKKTKE